MNKNIITFLIPLLLIIITIIIGNSNRIKKKKCKHRYRWWYSNTDLKQAKQVCIYCEKIKNN